MHDTQEFQTENDDSTVENLRFLWTRRALGRAASILSVSEATRRDLIALFGLPPNKIHVVYNAVDVRLQARPSSIETERTLGRYSANDPYLLYVGNARPHKNLARLIESFALVKEELREHPAYSQLKLLIIGDEISEHPELRHAVLRSRRQADIRFLGYVQPQQLCVFYACAAAFIFPSLHEGFGLPPLEAMSQGTPVLASNVSSLPEVLGDAALLVNPEKVFDISRGIQHLLLDDDLRRTLAERGRIQAAKFSWEDSVRRILTIYKQVAAGIRTRS